MEDIFDNSQEPLNEDGNSANDAAEPEKTDGAQTEGPITEETPEEAEGEDTAEPADEAAEESTAPKKSFKKIAVIAAVAAIAIALIVACTVFLIKKFSDDEEKLYLFSEGLICVKYDGKWGYVNKNGKMVIAATFDDAFSFTEAGIARVVVDDLYGYINKKGEYIVEPRFEDAEDFNGECRLAAVKDDGKWFVINKSGEEIFDARFDKVSVQNCGVVIVVEYDEDGEKKYRLTDDEGYDILNGKKYDYIGTFDDDTETAVISRKGKYGVVNKKGELIIDTDYENITNINKNGYAMFCEDGEWGIINKKEKIIMDPEYDTAEGFNDDNIARVGKKKGGSYEYGLINHKGEEILDTEFSKISEFSDDGLALICEKDRSGNEYYGYVNLKGEIVVDCDYEYATDFQDGYAVVWEDRDDDYSILINTKGEEIFEIEDYSLSAVNSDNLPFVITKQDTSSGSASFLYGFIDKKGDVLMECELLYTSGFSKLGRAIIGTEDHEFYLIDKNMDSKSKDYSFAFGIFDDGYAVVIEADGTDAYVGVINKNGKEKIELDYEDIKLPGILSDLSAMDVAVYYLKDNPDFDYEGWMNKNNNN